LILTIFRTIARDAKIGLFQASLFPGDAYFRKGAQFFAENYDGAGFGWCTLRQSLVLSENVYIAFSIRAGETAFRKPTVQGGQGL
jgi:hypothetical protein